MLAVCLIALTAFLFLLIAERAFLWYARKKFTLVIHVNGTRGKSTVTRLIHALLRRQGMEVFGKTTGSAARFLLPDGTERPVKRFGPANVREQRNMMIMSAFSKKSQISALVFECNAIHEELQKISMLWLKPDITVITNVREDHVRELGNAEDTALAFAAAIPDNSALVTSDSSFMSVWEKSAKQKKLCLHYAAPNEGSDSVNSSARQRFDFPENTACVLGVADHLGIERDKALDAISEYKPDAGAFEVYSWKTNFHSVFFADARAANDIESTDRLRLTAFQTAKQETNIKKILLLVIREDRPDRTWQFMQYIINRHREGAFDEYLCLGFCPLSFQKNLRREGVKFRIIKAASDLDSVLDETLEQAVCFFAAGNYGGPGVLVTQWLETKKQETAFRAVLKQ